MNTIKERIQKITSKGQVTLPISWRRRVKTNAIILKAKDNLIEIFPLSPSSNNSEYTVFDALRDNKGKGLKAMDLVKILKKIDK